LFHLPHIFDSLDGIQFNENSAIIEREPLTPITNDSNSIHNNDRIRNNDLHQPNKTYESCSRSYLNTTFCPNHPNNNTPPPTSRPHSTNNSYIGSTNDRDVFRLNTQNMFHSNTPLFTNDDSDARSTIRTSYNVESTFPASFSDMGNVHQIISWLCANPSILVIPLSKSGSHLVIVVSPGALCQRKYQNEYVDRLKIRGYPIITRGTLDNVFVTNVLYFIKFYNIFYSNLLQFIKYTC
jgi:hypothetical protein